MERQAAIRIGTNTILLSIVGQTPEGLPQTIMNLETRTRLGEVLIRTRKINAQAIQFLTLALWRRGNIKPWSPL